MRILLTGRNGQIGHELERVLAPAHDLIALDRAALDLSDIDAIGSKVNEVRPDAIVNAAAYTAVDRAESEKALAYRINAEAVGHLGEAAAACRSLLVHYSTDYVFDGEKPGAYIEEDAPHPLNAYGASKLEGEKALFATGCRHFIFRTSWVYGSRGKNFLLTILRAAREKPELRVVADQRGAPTSSVAIAAATARILAGPACASAPSGIYHLSAAGATSWHGFAEAILEIAGLRTLLVAISSDEYPAAARRPKNSLLENGKLERTFTLLLPGWREQLAAVMRAFH